MGEQPCRSAGGCDHVSLALSVIARYEPMRYGPLLLPTQLLQSRVMTDTNCALISDEHH